MTDYTTGTTKKYWGKGDDFPLFNSRNNPTSKSYWQQESFVIKLTGTTAAIATDTYAGTIFVAPRALIVRAIYLIDPAGLSDVDTTNYWYLGVYKGVPGVGPVLGQVYTKYGWQANQPVELRLANTEANRTLAIGDTVQFKITGFTLGRVINSDTEIWVVCSKV